MRQKETASTASWKTAVNESPSCSTKEPKQAYAAWGGGERR